MIGSVGRRMKKMSQSNEGIQEANNDAMIEERSFSICVVGGQRIAIQVGIDAMNSNKNLIISFGKGIAVICIHHHKNHCCHQSIVWCR